jgi:hypothetical protein
MMEVIRSSKMSVLTRATLHIHRCENLRSYINFFVAIVRQLLLIVHSNNQVQNSEVRVLTHVERAPNVGNQNVATE